MDKQKTDTGSASLLAAGVARAAVISSLLLCCSVQLASGAETMVDFSMKAAEGAGKIVLDGNAAIQFPSDAKKNTAAFWVLGEPLAPGWYTLEVGLKASRNTLQLTNLELLREGGAPNISINLRDAPRTSEGRNVLAIGVYLRSAPRTIRWRKNQTREKYSTPLVSLCLKEGRPESASIEAVETVWEGSTAMLPEAIGRGLMQAISAKPVSLTWSQQDGKTFTTPESNVSHVYLKDDIAGLAAESGVTGSFQLERRLETGSFPGREEELADVELIPLHEKEFETLTVTIDGAGLDPDAIHMADFPNGADIAAVLSWDDGNQADIRAAELMHQYGWRGSFFFNARSPMVARWKELEDLDQEVGSHSWSHPSYWLQTPERCMKESVLMRKLLETKVPHPVISFAYPFNYRPAYDCDGDYVLRAQKEAGYLASRTTMRASLTLDTLDAPQQLRTDGHFRMPLNDVEKVWEKALSKKRGIFYLWGHAWEMNTDEMWGDFDKLLSLYGKRPEAWYASQGDLMVWHWMRQNTTLQVEGTSERVQITLRRPKLHPWWARRVPVALHIAGDVKRAEASGRTVAVTRNNTVQVEWCQ